jgi:hypothetical protein
MSRKTKQEAKGTNRTKLAELAREAGCLLCSVGDIERLAGINTNSEQERHDLWFQFQHLFSGPSERLFDVVMDHCAAIVLRRIDAGELSLVKTF